MDALRLVIEEMIKLEVYLKQVYVLQFFFLLLNHAFYIKLYVQPRSFFNDFLLNSNNIEGFWSHLNHK